MTARTLRNIADWLTVARLVAVPLLWALALRGHEAALAVGLALASATDVVDGPLARRSGVPSSRGAQLDSVADLLLITSTCAFLVLLRPDFVADRLPQLLMWGAVSLLALAVGWLKFRRVANLHLYSAKLAGVVAYVFVIWLFLTGEDPDPFFYTAFGLATLASLEALLVQLTRRSVDENVRSLLRVPADPS